MGLLFSQLTPKNIIIEGEQSLLSQLVLISLFTDKRAVSGDVLPSGGSDKRGWIGDSFGDAWGSKLWLLQREKLTSEVRNRAVAYAKDALNWMTQQNSEFGQLASQVDVTGTIPKFQTLQLSIVITKPDGEQVPFQVSQLWESQRAV